MKATSITETKNKLSALLDEVKRGETILILDRGRPVARIVSAVDPAADADDGRLLRLEREGAIRRGEALLDSSFVDTMPKLPSDCESPLQALLEEREFDR